jgi:hypothetical protein
MLSSYLFLISSVSKDVFEESSILVNTVSYPLIYGLTKISKYREHGISRRLASAFRSNDEPHPDLDNLLSYLPLTSLHDQSLEMERVDANN